MKWIVQDNLGRHYADQIKAACEKLGYEYIPIKVIPFNHEWPGDLSKIYCCPCCERTVFYGATNWISMIHEQNVPMFTGFYPGTFFNPESTFCCWNYEYGLHSLNCDAYCTTLKEILEEPITVDFDELMFVRPESDQKEFAGQLIRRSEMKEWAEKCMTNAPDIYTLPIIVGEPYKIEKEWRLFIVGDEISSASQYRTNRGLDESPEVPDKILEFGKQMMKIYRPHEVFVMDVAEANGNLYVVEVGCFNSAGFYAANVEKVIKDVSEFVLQTVHPSKR